jgi:erythromycin esterase
LAVTAVGAGILVSGAAGAYANSRSRSVARWVARHASTLESLEPTAPLDDLAPLRHSFENADIVGLGESVHGAAEELRLKHRVVRFLVERMHFRSIAWEEDWSVGRRIDRFIRGGPGDAHALVRDMSPQWHSREVAAVLQWLRERNLGRADPVRFVGVEYYLTAQSAYDAIEHHFERTDPGQLAAARALLEIVRPPTGDLFGYIQWYSAQPDKRPYIRASRSLLTLLEGLPSTRHERARALAIQQARQIVSFYVHYSLPATRAWPMRDRRAAENLRWWRGFSGDKIVYWAASPHTANAPDLRITDPPAADLRFPSAGSHLRRWYGDRYRSIGFTFDHGEIGLGGGETAVAPPPSSEWFEQPLGAVCHDQFIIDLRAPAPAPVGRWLEAPIETRGVAGGGPGARITGGTVAQWFDIIVHRQHVTPAHDI